MTFRQAMEQALREMGADEAGIKTRLKFADSQCFAYANYGILDKPLSELLRPGATEKDIVDAIKAQAKVWMAKPESFWKAMEENDALLAKQNQRQ